MRFLGFRSDVIFYFFRNVVVLEKAVVHGQFHGFALDDDEVDALASGREKLRAIVCVGWVLFGVAGFVIEFFQCVEGGDHLFAGGKVGLRHFLADLGGEGVVGIDVHDGLVESNLVWGVRGDFFFTQSSLF